MGSEMGGEAAGPLQHPYYPPTVTIPFYTPNTASVAQLIASFGAIAGVIVVAAYWAAGGKGSRFADRFAAAWFGLCEFAHLERMVWLLSHRLPSDRRLLLTCL